MILHRLLASLWTCFAALEVRYMIVSIILPGNQWVLVGEYFTYHDRIITYFSLALVSSLDNTSLRPPTQLYNTVMTHSRP